jgi:hypothetical protein
MPQATSCWLADAEPEPETGSEPVALPAQTNWAEAGAAHMTDAQIRLAVSMRTTGDGRSLFNRNKYPFSTIDPLPNTHTNLNSDGLFLPAPPAAGKLVITESALLAAFGSFAWRSSDTEANLAARNGRGL